MSKVRWFVNSSETSTSAGHRNAATCATEFLTTEMARSASPLAASTTPTPCSTALPAIATTTRPANSGERPISSIVGRSAAMNHSDTNAAPSAAGREQADGHGQRQPGVRLLAARRRAVPSLRR